MSRLYTYHISTLEVFSAREPSACFGGIVSCQTNTAAGIKYLLVIIIKPVRLCECIKLIDVRCSWSHYPDPLASPVDSSFGGDCRSCAFRRRGIVADSGWYRGIEARNRGGGARGQGENNYRWEIHVERTMTRYDTSKATC